MKPKNKTDKYANKSSSTSDVPSRKNIPDNIFVLVFQAKTHSLLTLLKYISKLDIFQCRAYLH